MSATLKLTSELISRPSITPDDAGCQELVISHLEPLGFQIERLKFGNVTNLWARRGTIRPLLCLAGHTDVVPPGLLSAWDTDPFQPTICGDFIHGRGVADMKGGVAAMVTAVENFVSDHPNHNGSIAFLLTSDEEGQAVDGTVKVIDWLRNRNEEIDWCLLAEPSSLDFVGDFIKNGRRGSLNGYLKIMGKQAHIAFPHLANNPLHKSVNSLAELCATKWDDGNESFPPTSFQISNVHMGTGVENIIPGILSIWFNFRFSTANTPEQLKQQVANILNQGGFPYELEWKLSGVPFLTTPDCRLIDVTCRAVQGITGHLPKLSTSGGTSDGRFIAPYGAQVLELGLLNNTIHQVNECVRISDLDLLTNIYQEILLLLFNE
ncbi:succinyl-diaminopimelate desuccinylase [Achromatium sp. WMS2]|nr:succinyl-diaminopimelate desuccinylase [Achromatium sp. WMS2]